jgi:hypothetical protein
MDRRMISAQQLIDRKRKERRREGAPAPAGDPGDLELQLELVTDLLEKGLAYEAERAPQQAMGWSGDLGKLLPYGPAPAATDPLENPVLRGLATWGACLLDALNSEPRHGWTDEMCETLRREYADARKAGSLGELAESLGVDLNSLYNRAHRLGLSKPIGARRKSAGAEAR